MRVTADSAGLRAALSALASGSDPVDLAFSWPEKPDPAAPDDLDRLLSSPAMARVVELDAGAAHIGVDYEPEIRDYSDTMLESTSRTWYAAHFVKALASGRFTSLRRLSLRDDNLDDKDLAAVLAGVPPLESLDLSENRIGDAGFEALAASPKAAGLKKLSVGQMTIHPAGARALAQLARLAAFDAFLATFEGDALEVILAAPFAGVAKLVGALKGLRSTKALVASAWLPKQEELDLNHAPLPTSEIERLVASPAVANLRRLDLGHGKVGDPGARAIAGSPHLGSLEHLDLAMSGIGPEGAAALAGSPGLRSLVELDLGYNKIGDDGVAVLLKAWRLLAVRSLDLTSNDITDAGAKALAASPLAVSLESLNLHWNQVGDDGAVALARTAVKHLDLGSNALGKRGRQALEKRDRAAGPDPAPRAPARLRKGELASRARIEGHEGEIKAWDAAGSVIATAGADKTIRVWDAATGAQLRYIALRDAAERMALNADGTLAGVTYWSLYSRPLEVYETGTGRKRYDAGGVVRAFAFSPDGSLLCVADTQDKVQLCDAGTGATVTDLGYQAGSAWGFEFSVDSRFVRLRGEKKPGKPIAASKGAKGTPRWPEPRIISPDGDWELDLRGEPTLKRGGKAAAVLVGHEGIADGRFVLGGSTLVTFGEDRLTVRLWDVTEGAATGAPAPPRRKAVTAAELLAGAPPDTVPYADWEAMTDPRVAPLAPLGTAARLLKAGPFPCPALLLERNEEHLDPLPAPPALWSGNPKLPRRIDQSAVSADGAILVRALEGGEVEVFVAGRLAAHREFKHLITRLDFSPDGKTLMVGDREGFAELVDLDLKPLRPPFKKPSRGINDWLSAMALSPDGRRFAMHTHEGRTTLWDAADGAEIATYLGGGEALAFSGDGSRLAFPGHVVDSESGRVIAEIEVPSGSLALSHDGSLLAGGPSYGKDIEIRHVGSGANVASIPAKEWRVRRLAFVRGRLVARATAAYGTGPKHVHVWELIDFQPLGLLSPAEREAAKRRTEPAWRFVATLSPSQ